MSQFIEPRANIGIIGGGILAYGLVQAAHALGMHTTVLAPKHTDIALSAADLRIIGRANDRQALQELAQAATIITFADENVNGEALKDIAQAGQLPSGVDILDVTQDRYLEKVFLEDQNMNILPYAQVVSPDEIATAVETVGFPAILKPIQKSIGLDQQLKLERPEDVHHASQLLQQRPYVLEAWLDHPQEFSVLVAKEGETVRVLPVVENFFSRHQLMGSIVPASSDEAVEAEIQRIANVIAGKLDYNGVFGIELFMTSGMTLYVKRLFPGPQMNGQVLTPTTGVSPYEMHLRALLGWPLPNVQILRPGAVLPLRKQDRPAAMTQIQIKPDWQFRFYPGEGNLIGQMEVFGERSDVENALTATGYFHLNGKQ